MHRRVKSSLSFCIAGETRTTRTLMAEADWASSFAGRKLSNIARQERVGKRFRRADSIAGKRDLP
jgi:hypothetical protein